VLALARLLIERRTVTGAEIDQAIAIAIAERSIAVERQRRIEWRAVIARASTFRSND